MKVHLDESGSTLVRDAVAEAEIVFTSMLAYVETRAALARRRHAGDLTSAEHRRVLADFERDWDQYFVLDVTEPLVREAVDLAETYRLRAYDAVHLASARLAANRAREMITVGSWDVELDRSATALGFRSLRRDGR